MMKHKQLAFTCLAVTPFVMGCKPSADNAAAESRKTTADSFDTLKKETKEGV
jgi:hypothetical protein